MPNSLYWTNASGLGEWENDANWFTSDPGGPSNPNGAQSLAICGTPSANGTGPWTGNDIYKDYDLIRSKNEPAYPVVGVVNPAVALGAADGSWAITGECSIDDLTFNCPVYDGTYDGDGFTFDGDCILSNGASGGPVFAGSGYTANAGMQLNQATFGGVSYNGNGWVPLLNCYFTGGYSTNLDSGGNGYNTFPGPENDVYFSGGDITSLPPDGSGYDWYSEDIFWEGQNTGLLNGAWGWALGIMWCVYAGGGTWLTGLGESSGGSGWDALTGTYYINGYATSLPSSGTGWDSISNYYYIGGIQTTLSQGSGGTGWDSNSSTYFIDNNATDLPDNSGTGWSNSQNLYYISNVPYPGLNDIGDGWSGGVFYVSDNTGDNGIASSLPESGTGWDTVTGLYFVSGTWTSLPESGTGFDSNSGNYYYQGNQIFPASNSEFWTNASGDGSWENTGNWFQEETGTIPCGLGQAPWVNGNAVAANLYLATGEIGAPIIDATGAGTNIGLSYNPGQITGVCCIANVQLACTGFICDGLFVGANFTNNGGVIGGTASYKPFGAVAFSALVVDGICTYNPGSASANAGFPIYQPQNVVTGLPDIIGAGLL